MNLEDKYTIKIIFQNTQNDLDFCDKEFIMQLKE